MKDIKIDKRFVLKVETTPVSCTDFKHRKEIKLLGLVLRKECFELKEEFISYYDYETITTRYYVDDLPSKYFVSGRALMKKASVRIIYANGSSVCVRYFETDSEASEYARYISDCIKDAGNTFWA